MKILIEQNAAGAYEVGVMPDNDDEIQPPNGEVGLVLLRLSHTLLAQALEQHEVKEEDQSRIVLPANPSAVLGSMPPPKGN